MSTSDIFDIHHDVHERLSELTKSKNMPHILLHGPSGSGKRNAIRHFLYELYGPSALKTRKEVKDSINITSSIFHIEVSLRENLHLDDKVLIRDIMREIASTGSIIGMCHRLIILNNADMMSKAAQAAMRVFMEKYAFSCRFILVCRIPNNMIDAIRSRCLNIRIPSLTDVEMGIVLDDNICPSLKQSIIKESEGDIHRMNVLSKSNGKSTWNECINTVTTIIYTDRTPRGVLKIRDMFYDLISADILGYVIIDHLVKNIVEYVEEDSKKWEIIQLGSLYDNRLSMGKNQMIHLEAFSAKIMSILN